LGGRTMDCSTVEEEKVKGIKNRHKKIVMVKLIVQEEKKTHKTKTKEKQNKKQKEKKKHTRFMSHKKFSLLVKVVELSLVVQSGIGIQVEALMKSH
jgi:hypothetical protein